VYTDDFTEVEMDSNNAEFKPAIITVFNDILFLFLREKQFSSNAVIPTIIGI
jgi:hypothetical protein